MIMVSADIIGEHVADFIGPKPKKYLQIFKFALDLIEKPSDLKTELRATLYTLKDTVIERIEWEYSYWTRYKKLCNIKNNSYGKNN